MDELSSEELVVFEEVLPAQPAREIKTATVARSGILDFIDFETRSRWYRPGPRYWLVVLVVVVCFSTDVLVVTGGGTGGALVVVVEDDEV